MSRKDIRYLMPADYAKSYIPNIHMLAQQFSGGKVYKIESPAIAQGIRDLLKKVKNLPGKGDFKMTYGDCALLCGMMVKVNTVMHIVYPSLKKEEEEGILTEEGLFNLKFNRDLQKSIKGIMEDMCETFPNLSGMLADYRKTLHETDLMMRRMEADNKTIVLFFHMTEEMELRFLHLIFQMFNLMIVKGNYDFSEEVREASFFYITDFKEVFTKIETAARENVMTIDFTLRDVMVVFTVSNITQKLYFTDAGDDFMAIFDKVSNDAANGVSGIELRNLYMNLAARINNVIEQRSKDEFGFADFIEEVKNFML